MIFTLKKSIKLEIAEKTRPIIEASLYEALMKNGFDPETFNQEEFEPDQENLNHNSILEMLNKYNNIVNKIEELQD